MKNIVEKAIAAAQTLRDPSTAQAYSGASREYGAGWYDVGVSDSTGDIICVASAVTDIGSHAEALEVKINQRLGPPRQLERWEG